MSEFENLATPAIQKLEQSEPDQLYAELGFRLKAILNEPAEAGKFEMTATYDAEFAGPLDVLREIGQRFFARVSRDAYALVCGADQQNADERKKVLEAFDLGGTAVAAALVAAFVGTFGWAPAVATVVAALIMRLFFKNAYIATCEVWKNNLPAQ
jgi:hypothetical protein